MLNVTIILIKISEFINRTKIFSVLTSWIQGQGRPSASLWFSRHDLLNSNTFFLTSLK